MGVRRVLTPRWLLVHAAAVVLVVGFLLLAWWQVGRAAGGNPLSFGYALEWPVFAGFVVFVWVREARKAMRGESAGGPAESGPQQPVPLAPVRTPKRNEAAYDDHDDPALAAYNHYLGWLNANPHKSPVDYPGVPVRPSSPVKQGETL